MQVSRINYTFPSNPININTIIFGFVLVCLINYFINKCCRNRRIKELFWSTITNVFTETVATIGSGVTHAAYTTGDWVTDTSYAIGDGVKHVSYKIGEGTELVASGALNGMMSVSNAFVDVLDDTLDTLVTFGYELGDMAKEVGRTLGQVAILVGNYTGATEFLNAFVDTLGNISQSVINAIKDMLDPCYWAMNFACPLLLHGIVLSIQAATAPAAASTEATFMTATETMKAALQTMWNQATTGNKGVISSTAHKLVGAVVTPIVAPILLVILGTATGNPSYVSQISSSITLLITHVLVSQLLFGTKGLSYTYFIVEFLGGFMCDGKIFGIEIAGIIHGFTPYGARLLGCAKAKPNIGKTDAQMETDKTSRETENTNIANQYAELQTCDNERQDLNLTKGGSSLCQCKYGGKPKRAFSKECVPKTNRQWNSTSKTFNCKAGTVDDGTGNCKCPEKRIASYGWRSMDGKYCGNIPNYYSTSGTGKCEYPKRDRTRYGTIEYRACCTSGSNSNRRPMERHKYNSRGRRYDCETAPAPSPSSRGRYRRRRYYRRRR